ncbi:MAG: adenosine deaminase [Bdellovibrionales bacterium RIFCSPHIGHO2_01_FULL_40_29]|nr:MAG: adenosine deaminase [Bdellovibrionales bacterium RIFCSPHIGHO2_01_FULL_40_29]OFZ35431.1 MAG: adenosine deaminase [Bdellovibrionales bacterium RIFCSPHIGHO2_02_FULL_40_15]
MRWSTMLEIATTLGLKFPQKATEQQNHFLVTQPMANLEAVLIKFLTTQKLLASEEILERLAFEACEDAFNDGVRILELRYAPTFIAQGHSHLNYEKIHQALLRGIQRAKQKMPLAVGLICILQRILDLKTVDHVTSFAIENKNTFLALDLADNEDGFAPKNFAPFFQKAKAAGLNITVHSGESPDPRASQWILDSIEILGAQRIGHGVQAIHDPKVMQALIDKNIVLEICPYSNYLTQAFKTYESHPLRKLFDAGVPVTINSDDPGIFASVLSDDYLLAQNYQKFTKTDFNTCNETAYKHSFISESEKAKVWN